MLVVRVFLQKSSKLFFNNSIGHLIGVSRDLQPLILTELYVFGKILAEIVHFVVYVNVIGLFGGELVYVSSNVYITVVSGRYRLKVIGAKELVTLDQYQRCSRQRDNDQRRQNDNCYFS